MMPSVGEDTWHHLITETLKKGHTKMSRKVGLQLRRKLLASPEGLNQELDSGESVPSCTAVSLSPRMDKVPVLMSSLVNSAH
jgi:hypothetical protein